MADINLAKLARMGLVEKVGAGTVVVTEGDPGSEMFIILSGKVDVIVNSAGGVPVSVAEIGPGGFFGEMSLLEGMPRGASVRAITDSVLLVIDQSNFEAVMAEQPFLAHRIMKGLSGRVRQQNEEIKKLKMLVETSFGQVTAGGGSNKDDDGGQMPGQVLSTVQAAPDKKDEEVEATVDRTLFPPGHKQYNVVAPESHGQYLFIGKVNCPVCRKTSETQKVRSTKLKLLSIDPDLRQRFADCEPVWYTVWACPYCNYANVNTDFDGKMSEAAKSLVKKRLDELRGTVNLRFTVPRKIDQVFAAYYMTLQCLEAMNADNFRIGRVWLRLAWLYSDVEDQEMFKIASSRALECYKDAFYKEKRETSPEEDQRLNLLLGELTFRSGNFKDAQKHFRDAILPKHKGGTEMINRQAQDRIQDLKQMAKEFQSANDSGGSSKKQ